MTLLQTPLLALAGRDAQGAASKGRGDGAGAARNAASFGDLYQAHVSGRPGSASTSTVASAPAFTTEVPVSDESVAPSQSQSQLASLLRVPVSPRAGDEAVLPFRPSGTAPSDSAPTSASALLPTSPEVSAPVGTAASAPAESPARTVSAVAHPARSFPGRRDAVTVPGELPAGQALPAQDVSALTSASPEQEVGRSASVTVDARSASTQGEPAEATPHTHSEHADTRTEESVPDVAPRVPGPTPPVSRTVPEPSADPDAVSPTATRAVGEQTTTPNTSRSAPSVTAPPAVTTSTVPGATSSTDTQTQTQSPAPARPSTGAAEALPRVTVLSDSRVEAAAPDAAADLGKQTAAVSPASSSTTPAVSGITASAVAATSTTGARADQRTVSTASTTAPAEDRPAAPAAAPAPASSTPSTARAESQLVPPTAAATPPSSAPTMTPTEDQPAAPTVPDSGRPRTVPGSTSGAGTQPIPGDRAGAPDLLPDAPSRVAASSADTDGALPTSPAPAPGTPVEGAASPLPANLGVTAAGPTTAASAPPVPVRVPVPLPQQLGAPAFALAQSVVDAAGGTSTITVTVAPEDLGPITIRASLSAEGTRLEFFSATEGGRDAVRQALPDLRREASASGLSAALDLGAGDPGDRDAPPRQARTPVPSQQEGRQHEPAPSRWAGHRPADSSTLDLLA